MKMKPVPEKLPELTVDAKFEIRNRQLQIAGVREQLRMLEQSLANYVRGTLVSMGLDDKHDVDGQTLIIRKVAITGK